MSRCGRRAALAMAGGLTLLGAPAAAQDGVRIGLVEQQAGDATAFRGGRSSPLTPGAAVNAGDRIHTGRGARIAIAFVDGLRLVVGPESAITLSRHVVGPDDSRLGAIYALFGGIVRLLAPPRPGPSEIAIVTRAAVASVRSTEWIVDEKPSGATGVFTVTGVVEVRGERGQAVSLPPGFGTDVAPGEAPTAPKRWGQARVDEAVARLGFR